MDEVVLKVAAVTKLTRNLFLAAVIPALGWVQARQDGERADAVAAFASLPVTTCTCNRWRWIVEQLAHERIVSELCDGFRGHGSGSFNRRLLGSAGRYRRCKLRIGITGTVEARDLICWRLPLQGASRHGDGGCRTQHQFVRASGRWPLAVCCGFCCSAVRGDSWVHHGVHVGSVCFVRGRVTALQLLQPGGGQTRALCPIIVLNNTVIVHCPHERLVIKPSLQVSGCQ